jgi:hypothetical protein
MTNQFKISDILEKSLSSIILKLANIYNIEEYKKDQDFLDPRMESWHQFGLLSHTKKVRESFLKKLPNLLKEWGILKKVTEVLNEKIKGITKKDLFEISIILHDLGKIPVYNNNRDNREHEILSKELVNNSFINLELKNLGLLNDHIALISRYVETHDVLSKDLRIPLRDQKKLRFEFFDSDEVKNLCKLISEKYLDIKVEIGIFFLCDTLGKTEMVSYAESLNSEKYELLITKFLKEKNASLKLKSGILQAPQSLKLSEIYLKTILV